MQADGQTGAGAGGRAGGRRMAAPILQPVGCEGGILEAVAHLLLALENLCRHLAVMFSRARIIFPFGEPGERHGFLSVSPTPY